MNHTDSENLTTAFTTTYKSNKVSPGVALVESLPTQTESTTIQVLTTVAPASSDSAVIAVVVILILLTLAALSFVLCRYLYHNRGDYRTTGELAPGEDPDEEDNNKPAPEKKEYFI
ncbi:glycophorin-C-like [Pundamilia nyererei]|uniref:Glycophorin-C-like n=3 Tax=Haplochromini TaxID=319058 RepID=A0A9Y3RVV0_9CICH|nr:PREDICTED: glycophorin-C-like [Pundamilia nyererei]